MAEHERRRGRSLDLGRPSRTPGPRRAAPDPGRRSRSPQRDRAVLAGEQAQDGFRPAEYGHVPVLRGHGLGGLLGEGELAVPAHGRGQRVQAERPPAEGAEQGQAAQRRRIRGREVAGEVAEELEQAVGRLLGEGPSLGVFREELRQAAPEDGVQGAGIGVAPAGQVRDQGAGEDYGREALRPRGLVPALQEDGGGRREAVRQAEQAVQTLFPVAAREQHGLLEAERVDRGGAELLVAPRQGGGLGGGGGVRGRGRCGGPGGFEKHQLEFGIAGHRFEGGFGQYLREERTGSPARDPEQATGLAGRKPRIGAYLEAVSLREAFPDMPEAHPAVIAAQQRELQGPVFRGAG